MEILKVSDLPFLSPWHFREAWTNCQDWGYRYLAAPVGAKTLIHSAVDARQAFVDGSYSKLQANGLILESVVIISNYLLYVTTLLKLDSELKTRFQKLL